VTTSIVLESPLASAITKSELGIRKNGTDIICATTDDTPIALGNNIRSLTTSTIINLSANDTLQAVVNLFGASATGQGLRLPSLFGTTATQVSNISIERLEVSEFDVDSTIIDGSANAVSGNAVFDGLALKADKSRVEQVLRSKNNGTYGSHTGNTTNTAILTIPITGGEFAIGDWMNLMFDFTKVGTAGTANIRFYAGTLGTVSDPSIATCFLTATVLDIGFGRERFQFKTGNILSGINNTFSTSPFDLTPSTIAKQSTSLNPANNWTLTIAVQLANAGDTVSCEGYTISKVNSF